jgi:hypothetical protein
VSDWFLMVSSRFSSQSAPCPPPAEARDLALNALCWLNLRILNLYLSDSVWLSSGNRFISKTFSSDCRNAGPTVAVVIAPRLEANPSTADAVQTVISISICLRLILLSVGIPPSHAQGSWPVNGPILLFPLHQVNNYLPETVLCAEILVWISDCFPEED